MAQTEALGSFDLVRLKYFCRKQWQLAQSQLSAVPKLVEFQLSAGEEQAFSTWQGDVQFMREWNRLFLYSQIPNRGFQQIECRLQLRRKLQFFRKTPIFYFCELQLNAFSQFATCIPEVGHAKNVKAG
jgi:hypothetical protein